jgi:hypothetical protein
MNTMPKMILSALFGLLLVNSAYAQTKYVIGTSAAATHRISNLDDLGQTYLMFRNALSQLKSGGTLMIEEGTYKFSDALLIPQNVQFTLKGAGKDKTILMLADEAAMPSRKQGLLNVQLGATVLISDLTLNGNKEKQTKVYADGKETRDGLYCSGCNGIEVSHVRSLGWRGDGFTFQGKDISSNVTNTTIVSNIKVFDCQAEGNDLNGFKFVGVSAVNIDASSAYGNGIDGFSFTSTSDVTMSNVVTTQNYRDGVRALRKNTNFKIDNHVSTSDGHGSSNGIPLSGSGLNIVGFPDAGADSFSVTNSKFDNSNRTAVQASYTNDLRVSSSSLTGDSYCLKVTFTSGKVDGVTCNALKGIPAADPTTANFAVGSVTYNTTSSSYVEPPVVSSLTPTPVDSPAPVDPLVSPSPEVDSPSPSPAPPANSAASMSTSGLLMVAVALALKAIV